MQFFLLHGGGGLPPGLDAPSAARRGAAQWLGTLGLAAGQLELVRATVADDEVDGQDLAHATEKSLRRSDADTVRC